jgi:hypothetical protein
MAMPSPATQTDREVLAGIVERVTFHSAEARLFVLPLKARGHRDLITIVGHTATISEGEWITASGDWVNDRIYGQQFKVCFLPARQAERGQLAGKRGSYRPKAAIPTQTRLRQKGAIPLSSRAVQRNLRVGCHWIILRATLASVGPNLKLCGLGAEDA